MRARAPKILLAITTACVACGGAPSDFQVPPPPLSSVTAAAPEKHADGDADWANALDSAADSWAGIPEGAAVVAIRFEDASLRRAELRDTNDASTLRVRARLDGRDLPPLLLSLDRQSTAFVAAAPVAPGSHMIDLELFPALVNGDEGSVIVARSVAVDVPDAEGVVVRAVARTPVGKSNIDLDVTTHGSKRVGLAEKAQRDLSRMAIDIADIQSLLDEKRRLKDVVWVLCLNDKLTQAQVAKRSADERLEAMASAIKNPDVERAIHESIIIAVLRTRTSQLAAEGRQCI